MNESEIRARVEAGVLSTVDVYQHPVSKNWQVIFWHGNGLGVHLTSEFRGHSVPVEYETEAEAASCAYSFGFDFLGDPEDPDEKKPR